MIDVRKTLENLHQILPELNLEDLSRILDAIEEVPQINIPYVSTREFCSTDSASTYKNSRNLASC